MMLPSAWRPTRTIVTAAKVNAVSVSARIAALQIRWNRRFDEVRLNSFEIILSPRAEPQNTGFKFARGQFCANSVLTDLFGRAVTWIRALHTTFDDWRFEMSAYLINHLRVPSGIPNEEGLSYLRWSGPSNHTAESGWHRETRGSLKEHGRAPWS